MAKIEVGGIQFVAAGSTEKTTTAQRAEKAAHTSLAGAKLSVAEH